MQRHHQPSMARILMRALTVFTVIASGNTAVAAESESYIEEIIVTATKRTASVQEVPISIAVLQEETLTNAGIESITDLSSMVAGFDSVNQGAGESSIAIRGIAEFSGDFFITPTVGLYVDEAPLVAHPARSPELAFFDANRVEVLRGPQGTLFGDGSLGGTVRIITNKPDSTKVSGRVLGSFSSWDGGGDNYSLKGVFNAPVIEDRLAFRVAATFRDDGGYVDNELAGTLLSDTSDINNYDSTTIRAALRATPNDNLTIDLVYNYSDLDVNDLTEEQFPGIKNRFVVEPLTNEMDWWSLTFTYELSWASFVSATSYTKIDQTSAFDITDFVAPGFPFLQFIFPEQLGGLSVIAARFDIEDEQETITQELRLASSGDGPLNWTVGGFYRNDKRHEFEDIPTFPDDIGLSAMGVRTLDFTFDQEFDQWAVFGELDYQIGDINLLVGARYYEEDKESSTITKGWLTFLPPEFNAGSDSADTFIPKGVIRYTPNEMLTVYLSYTEGFRAGGVNALADAAKVFGASLPAGFDPESLQAWEIGVKKIWMDGRLRTNVYVYQNSWEDMIQSFIEPTSNFSFDSNAGKSESEGIEFELMATLSERLDVSIGVAYIQAEFQEDVFDPGTMAQLVVDGNRIPHIPEWSYSASIDYRVPLGRFDGYFRADFSHRGDTFAEVSNSEISKTDNLDILNLRAGVTGERWGAYLFANNVTDEDGAILAFSPLTPSINDVDATFVRPREVGIELRFSY